MALDVKLQWLESYIFYKSYKGFRENFKPKLNMPASWWHMRKGRGSPKSEAFLVWGPWIYKHNLLAIYHLSLYVSVDQRGGLTVEPYHLWLQIENNIYISIVQYGGTEKIDNNN